ncbi:hypothetical protein LNK15_07000 [Jeotgalicoccus huakuii]|nr:hypothetical protein [Jeotgalicoccus huakuii]
MDKWVKHHQAPGSFSHLDNCTDEERELRQLRKENEQLKMGNDILKQEVLIMGRK